jgi:hypothetical protein
MNGADLMNALKDVRAFSSDELTEQELHAVDELVRAVEHLVYR